MSELLRDESGTTAIEYALIGSLVSVAIIGAAIALGEELKYVYDVLGVGLAASVM